jgi:hypothetical protein
MSTLLEQASLVMIPSGYKEDIVYSAVPTDGSGDLSFTRASNGTRVNSAGLVEDVPWNLAQNSEQYNAGTWLLAFLSISIDSAVAPNGTTTADLLYPSSSQAYCYVSTTSFSVVAGQTYTQSVYLKRSGFRWGIVDNMAGSPGAWFDLLNGVVGNVASGCTASIESVGNGWYRCSVSSVAQSGTNYADFRMSDANGGSTVTANGTDGLLAWGFQLNIGSTAKPYFPTTDRLNVPRLTYQNGGGGCPSLLLEKQSTNLCLYSEQIDNASWDKVNGSGGTAPVVTANYGISPDGTQNADRIQLARTTAAGSYSYVYQTITLSASATYTVSVYLKSLSGTPTISIALDGVGYDHVVTMTTEWARYEVEIVAGGSFDRAQLLLYQAVPSTSLTADFLAWGFQVEQSSYPTSYISTTSASATRVADTCSKTGISSLIGQSEGVLFVDFNNVTNPEAGDYNMLATISDSANDYIYISKRNPTGIEIYGGVGATTYITSGVFVDGQRYKVALAYKNNDFAVYINGSSIWTDTSGTIAVNTPNKLSVGSYYSQILNFNSGINQCALFKTRLSNSDLIALTTI